MSPKKEEEGQGGRLQLLGTALGARPAGTGGEALQEAGRAQGEVRGTLQSIYILTAYSALFISR